MVRLPRRFRWRAPDRRSVVAIGIVYLVAVAAIGLGVVVERSLEPEPAIAAPIERPAVVTTTTTTSTTTTTTTTPITFPGPPGTPPLPAVPPTTRLATPDGVIPTYDAPGGTVIGSAGRWYGYPMTMPILREYGEYLEIRLPERPNESTGWVRRDQVAVSSTPDRIIIRLSQMDLTVYEAGIPQFTAPVGIGTERTPTPPGSFFVAVIERSGRTSGYGPIVLDLSGHSEAIQSWQGSGDAIIAVHGPISPSSDARIGTTGTRISNGCIRMHLADQLRLDGIDLGTPVNILP